MTVTSRVRRTAALFAFLPALLLTGCEPESPGEEEAAQEEAGQEAGQETGQTAGAETDSLTIADVGFSTPESVLYDSEADVYLVSNISGEPLGEDGDGFISRVSPDGTLQELRWIDSAGDAVTLDAPKGMAVSGDRLYVADIDVLRVFDRESGEPLEEHPVEGASFLNDVAAGSDGAIYFTDTGVDAAFEGTGTDAVYALRDGQIETIAEGSALMNPNGIAVDGDGLVVVPFGGAALLRVPLDGGEPTEIATLPAGQLDGVVVTGDGSYLVSSWEGEAVYRVSADGGAEAVVEGVPAPADIGWDGSRNRVLIPLFMDDRVEVRTP